MVAGHDQCDLAALLAAQRQDAGETPIGLDRAGQSFVARPVFEAMALDTQDLQIPVGIVLWVAVAVVNVQEVLVGQERQAAPLTAPILVCLRRAGNRGPIGRVTCVNLLCGRTGLEPGWWIRCWRTVGWILRRRR